MSTRGRTEELKASVLVFLFHLHCISILFKFNQKPETKGELYLLSIDQFPTVEKRIDKLGEEI